MKRWAFILCLVVATLGCGGSKQDRTYEVSGTVQLDKKPLKEGQITFADTSGLVPTMIPITDGQYKGKVRTGNYRVEIRAYRLGKELPSGPGVKGEQSRENFIPDRFNTKSEFKAEVKPEGPNQFTFEVQSK